MFGFPEKISEWGMREYLRLFTFIAVYLFVRPLIQSFFEKLGERQRKRQQLQIEEEQIRKHKLQRAREKLGIQSEGSSESATTDVATKAASQSSGTRARNARRDVKAPQRSAMQHIYDDMPSDEDVSDLIS